MHTGSISFVYKTTSLSLAYPCIQHIEESNHCQDFLLHQENVHNTLHTYQWVLGCVVI